LYICSGAFSGWVATYRCDLLEKILEKLALFEKFRSGGKKEAKPGGGIMEKLLGKVRRELYSLHHF